MSSWQTRSPRLVPREGPRPTQRITRRTIRRRAGRGLLRRPMPFVLAAVFSLFVALLTPGAASASTIQVCGNNGSGYCMNNWNGAGTWVKMYYGGTVNDSFKIIHLTGDCNGGHVSNGGTHGNCPFTDPDLDQQYAGAWIDEVKNTQTGLCVSGAGGQGILGACGSSNGSGAATGAIMIEVRPLGCNNFNTELIDRYWDDFNSGVPNAYVTSGGNPGLGLNLDAASPTCWGGPGVPN